MGETYTEFAVKNFDEWPHCPLLHIKGQHTFNLKCQQFKLVKAKKETHGLTYLACLTSGKAGYGASLVPQTVKNLPEMQKTWVQCLGQEDPLQNGMATPVFLPGEFHGQRSLAGYSPWGHERVGRDLVTKQQQHEHKCISSLWLTGVRWAIALWFLFLPLLTSTPSPPMSQI